MEIAVPTSLWEKKDSQTPNKTQPEMEMRPRTRNRLTRGGAFRILPPVP